MPWGNGATATTRLIKSTAISLLLTLVGDVHWFGAPRWSKDVRQEPLTK